MGYYKLCIWNYKNFILTFIRVYIKLIIFIFYLLFKLLQLLIGLTTGNFVQLNTSLNSVDDKEFKKEFFSILNDVFSFSLIVLVKQFSEYLICGNLNDLLSKYNCYKIKLNTVVVGLEFIGVGNGLLNYFF